MNAVDSNIHKYYSIFIMSIDKGTGNHMQKCIGALVKPFSQAGRIRPIGRIEAQCFKIREKLVAKLLGRRCDDVLLIEPG